MWWAIGGIASLALLGFGIFVVRWLIGLGKTIHKGEDARKRNIELEGQAKDRNKFIKSVDRLNHEKDVLKKKARDAFRRGSVRDLLRVYDEARKDPKAPKA